MHLLIVKASFNEKYSSRDKRETNFMKVAKTTELIQVKASFSVIKCK